MRSHLTNLWISFLISRKLNKIDELIEKQHITLIFSNELIEEFVEVANRPKFKKYFSQKDIEKTFDNFDEKDNFLLNLAIDAKADFLITEDKDLLV